jgi:Prealbumin-like fold domain
MRRDFAFDPTDERNNQMAFLRFKRRSVRRFWLFGVLLTALCALFVASAAGNLPGSTFDAGDGNLVVNGAETDWASASVGIDCPPGAVFGCALDKPSGQQDDSFGQGTKEDTPAPTIIDGGIPPSKSDLQRFYTSNEKVGDDQFLYLAWERVQEPQGTTNMDFEFNKRDCTPGLTPPDPDCSANGVTPIRSLGDLLIKYDLSQGGTNPILGFHRWVTSGDPADVCEANNSVPCWGPVQDLTGDFEGSINTEVVSDPIAPNAPRNLSVRTFGEAAVNLTDSGILPPGTCESFGSAYLKSRSSDSFTAAVKDFISPIPVTIQSCGQIIIRKQTIPNGAAGTFGYTTTGGLDPATFSLSDDGVQDYGADTPEGTYTVTENDPTPGFDLSNLQCTVTGGAGSTATPNLASRTVTIVLHAPDVVDCTYTNSKRGKIIVEKQTDPDGATGSFAFTGDAAGSISDGGQIVVDNLVPGTYTSTEGDPTPGFDLVSILCTDTDSTGSLVTRTATFRLQAGEMVKCTFTNRQRGQINIHKRDDSPDPGAPLQGATFELYTDIAPLDGPAPHGAEDTATGLTCTTDAAGDCSITNVVPGQYWVVETVGVPGHDLAPDQNVIIGAGGTVSRTFTDPRKFKVIVLVCKESDNSLYSSTVTVDTENKNSLGSAPPGLTEAALCALGGASYAGKHTGAHPANVNIPTNELP